MKRFQPQIFAPSCWRLINEATRPRCRSTAKDKGVEFLQFDLADTAAAKSIKRVANIAHDAQKRERRYSGRLRWVRTSVLIRPRTVCFQNTLTAQAKVQDLERRPSGIVRGTPSRAPSVVAGALQTAAPLSAGDLWLL